MGHQEQTMDTQALLSATQCEFEVCVWEKDDQ